MEAIESELYDALTALDSQRIETILQQAVDGADTMGRNAAEAVATAKRWREDMPR